MPAYLSAGFLVLAAVLLPALFPSPSPAGHEMGNQCYTCHNIRSGQVWQGSYSVWSGKDIGMTSYGRPITCEVCHTNYGAARFTASSASHHPVQVISGTSMATDNWTTTVILCKDCHNADSVSGTPNLIPDLAPSNYLSVAGNTGTDGYPNHDVFGTADNQVNAGDPPHLLAMRLSAGQRTAAGSGTYNKVPSSNPASDYAFCFSCHDGSNNTSRGALDNILAAYVTKGHYFKSKAPTGGAINDRIPCSDCHSSHNSATNARLFEPDNTTWTGVRPTGLAMANEASPTAAELRAICIFCHEDYSVADTTTTSKQVRTVQPIRRKYGVTGHAPTDTQSCNQCHNTHNPPAGGDDCLNCHRTGGGVQAKHQLTDLEFPADGTWNAGAGEDNAAVQVSGHKGVVYTTPYNTKALNECKKCHGTAHPSDAAKVQAADGTSTWPTGFVYGLSWNGSAWSANAASFADGNGNNIIDGNEFCVSCHDGVDALSPTDNANIRIGGVNPPVVWFPSGGQSTGHDRKAGSNYPVSGNAPAQQLCTSCHKYHTSDRPQLFPGNFGPFGAGSGYTYSMPTWGGIATNWQAPRPATSSFPSNAGRVVVGNVNANALNFTDRSNPSSGKGFGTAGDNTGTNGFCNACHRDASTVTAGTLNTAHTHEGNGVSPSKNTFAKDCVECHNPHGGGTTPNISMIRQTVGRDNVTQNAVVFTARTGANSFDELDGAVESNLDDLCATCHNGPSPISHNFRAENTAGDHNQGTACTLCHPHGQTDNAAKFGFPQAACNSCHGAQSDAAGMPAPGDNGVYHVDANPVIGTRGSDNTSHKIHVNYLNNKRGVTGASACYVCHKGGGGQESHPGNPTNVSFKSGTQPTASYVQVVIDNAWRLDNNIGSATYSGTPGTLADNTNGWKTCSNTSCHYALSPSWAGKQQRANYLAVTDGPHRAYPPLTAFGKGADNVVVNEFRMQTTAGTGATTVDNIVIAGVNVSGNVAASGVRVYRDNGDNTFLPASDTAVGAAVSFAADNTATLSGFSEAVNETGANYWIVFTLSASPANGAVVNARVASVRTALAAGAVVSATNAPAGTVVDTQLPASSVTTSGYFTSAPVTVAGTSSDNNSGVNHVDISIRNGATGNYWNGGAFGSAAEFWVQAAGTTSWSYPFNPPVDNTFLVRSRATDNVSNVQTAMGTGSFVLDRVRPTVTSAVAQDNTHVLVTFSEAVDNTTASDNTFYAITGGAGLTVSAAARREAIDNATVLLTTSLQSSGQAYTVSVDNVAPGVTDVAGNVVGNPGSANFTGFTSNSLNVTDGPNDPSTTLFVRGGGSGTGRLTAQQFRMATSTGSASVTQIVVTKAGAATVPANGAYLFRDTGATAGQLDGTDNQIGRVSFAGNTATFALTESVNTTGANYLVVVDIDNSATLDNQSLTTQVTGVTGSIPVSNTTTVSRSITMDKTLPLSAITTTSPYTAGTGPSDNVTIQGTASDNVSGVHHVDVAIQRVPDSQWWNGSAWQVSASPIWVASNGGTPTAWNYTAIIGDNTFNVQSRSTDNSNDNTFTAGNGNLQSPTASLSGLVVDRVHPTVVSAQATDNTHVRVTFSERVEKTSAETASYYVITGGAGLTVSAAARQDATDNAVVLLTTSAQTAGTVYTVAVDNVAPGVNDLNGNVVGTPGSATFTGKGPSPATTYIVNINSGTNLGWVTTNMTTGAGKYSKNDNTTLVKSGQVTTSTYYGTTTQVTDNVAFTAVWNTAVPAGNNLTITGVTFRVNGRQGSGSDRIRMQLLYFNNTTGAETVIYDTNWVVPAWSTTVTTGYTHDNQAITPVAVPDGVDLGFRVRYNQTSGTAMRVYVASASGMPGNDNVTLYGTNSTGVAPAPPRATGDTTAISCNTCHQFGPDDATAGYKSVAGFNQYYYALPGSHAAHGMAGLDNGNPVASQAQDTCTVCHPAGASTYGYDHASGAVNTRTGSIGTQAAGPAFTDDGTYDNATRTCSNVYCHAGRPTPQATGKSWGYGTAVCGTCHAVTPPFGKHAIHNNGNVATTPTETSTAGNYDYSCYYCHPSGAAHVNYPASLPASDNQAAQVSFSGTLGGQTLAGTYTAAAASAGRDNNAQGLSFTNGSCGTAVYCHSNGRGGSPLVTPTWNQSGFPTAACTGCHDTRGPSTQLSTRHQTHTDNTPSTGYNFTCDECHALTVANDCVTTLHATTGRPNHVDGTPTVSFSTTFRTTALNLNGPGTYTQGVDNCANTYCHSDGTSIKNSGTIQPNAVTWGAAALSCTGCHGYPPSYPTSGTRRNSHPAHLSFNCTVCHSQTKPNAGDNVINGANHVNGSYNVSGTGFTYTYDNVNGSTCAFTSGCHGTSTPRWGVLLSGFCFACHQGAEGTNKPQGAADNNANFVDNVQYFQSGHGRTGSNYPVSNNAPAGKWNGGTGGGCYTTDPEAGCHASTAAHVPASASDPYRLGATYADNTTGLCLTCHGASGPANTRNMQEHGKALTGSAKTWPNGYDWKCVDCHDPHGDGTDAARRLQMIRSAINNPTGLDNANLGSNSKGSPLRAPGWTGITFTDNTGFAAGSYAIPGAGTWGICEGCHRQTTAYNQTQDNTGSHATRTGNCIACHPHAQSFQASCNTCHGDINGTIRGDGSDFPPQGPRTGTGGWAGRNWAELQATAASRGDHQRHAGTGFYGKSCTQCHTTLPGSDAAHATNKTNATMTAMSTFGTWAAGALTGDQSVTDDSCANVTCHSPYSAENPSNTYRSGTPFTTGPNAYTRYWVDNVNWNCYTCHAYDGRTQNTGPVPRPGGADNVMRTGSHSVHVDNTQLGCVHCHPSGSYTVTHKSGFVNWDFTGAPNPYADSSSYSIASGTRAPTDNTAGRLYGSCSNLYCHSNAQTSPPGGAIAHSTPTWGTVTSGNCGTCHRGDGVTDNAASRMSSGTHTTHVDNNSNGGYSMGCAVCHKGGGTMSPLHADGIVQVPMDNGWRNFTLGWSATVYDNNASGAATDDNGAWVGADAAYGRCYSIPCHTNGQGGAPLVNPAVWGATDTTCTYCHGTRGPSTQLSTRHQTHTDNTPSTGYNFTCDECHALTVANDCVTTLHATTGRANHVDNVVTVSFSTTFRTTALNLNGGASFTQGIDNCANTYCHSDGSSVKNGGIVQSNAITWASGVLSCTGCHGYPPSYPTSGARRNSHPAHLSFNCTVCHSQTKPNAGDNVINGANHVNGSYNVSGTGFTYGYDNALGSTCAFTSGCHGTSTPRWGVPLAGGCFACHAGTEQIYKPQNDYGTPGVANPVDNNQYLSRGHGRPQASGNYVATNNPAAHMDNVAGTPSDCYYCHSQTAGHIPTDNTNDPFRLGYGSDTTGQKGSAALKGAYADNVNLLCMRCHGSSTDRSGVAEAATTAFNMQTHAYGITGTTYATWPVTPWKCIDCHDPHGDANNAMIRSGINAPNSGSDTLAGSDVKGRPQRTGADVHAITFTDNTGYAANSYAVPGAGSWGICEVCHTRTAAYAASGAGTDNAGTHASRTGNCIACHSHTQGFKGACNICHSYPGQDNTGTNLKQMSRGHWDHVGQPGAGGDLNSRDFPCELCHFNYVPVHNQNGYTPGQAWGGTYYTNVSVRFDNTWNPGAVTYNGQNAGTATAPGNGGTGVCAGLYCHGGNAALNAGWNGTGPSPRWDNTSYLCGACHDTGLGDTTPSTRQRTGNHPAHIDNVWGPGIAAFSAGGNCAEGAGCHTAYGLTPTSTHVNNQVNLRTSGTDNTATTLSGTQVCRNCHSTYTNAGNNLPSSGDTLVRTQANWDNATYKVACITCHNDASDASTPPASQGRQNLDGSGAIAPNVMAAYYGNGHGAAVIDNASTTTDTGSGATDQTVPVRCDACHNELAAHLGTVKDTTNPYRLDNAVVNFTQTGAVDQWCLAQCHTTTATHPARHAWRVNGSAPAPAQTKDNTVHTHPTTMQVVPQSGAPSGETLNKDRWFQIPDASLPVQADLLTKTPGARTTGSLLVCVTCHDPHGVPAAPVSRRSFSGASDNGFQMLRYKSGTLMALCGRCHL